MLTENDVEFNDHPNKLRVSRDVVHLPLIVHTLPSNGACILCSSY